MDCANPELQSSLNLSSKDKFILILTLPQALRKMSRLDPALDVDFLQMTVHGAIVPDISVPAVEVRYGGQSANFSSYSRPNYAPLSVNFIIDNGFKNYYVLWKWLAILNDPRTSTYEANRLGTTRQDQRESGNNAEYQTNFVIQAMNEYNEISMEFHYYNAFITGLKGITYSYRDGEIAETSADFSFGQLDMKRPTI